MFDKQMERVRSRLIDVSESVRIASQVRAVAANDGSVAPVRVPVGRKAILILTDRRLVVAGRRWFDPRPMVWFEWPLTELRFTTRRPRLGSDVVNVEVPGGGGLEFEWLGGAPASLWTKAHYRARSVSRFRPFSTS